MLLENAILKSESVGNRRYHAVRARYADERVELELLQPPRPFAEMREERTQARDPREMAAELQGPQGCRLANVGVSALISLHFGGSDYLVAGLDHRTDRAEHDDVAKLISSYVPAGREMERQAMAEIAEELLPMADGEIMPGFLGNLLLGAPYAQKVPYSTAYSFHLEPGCDFQLPGMKTGPVIVRDGSGEAVLGEHAQFHAAADTNSGQILFPYSMTLSGSDWLSLSHAEERFNPASGMLETVFHPQGILLLERGGSAQLSGRAYTLANGKLLPYAGPVMLSEAFAPKTNGVSSAGSIALEEFVSMSS